MLTFRSSILLQGPANTPELETLVVLVSLSSTSPDAWEATRR